MHAGLQMMLDRGELLKALRQLKRGDFAVRMPLNSHGIDGEIAQAFNDVVELERPRLPRSRASPSWSARKGSFTIA